MGEQLPGVAHGETQFSQVQHSEEEERKRHLQFGWVGFGVVVICRGLSVSFTCVLLMMMQCFDSSVCYRLPHQIGTGRQQLLLNIIYKQPGSDRNMYHDSRVIVSFQFSQQRKQIRESVFGSINLPNLLKN